MFLCCSHSTAQRLQTDLMCQQTKVSSGSIFFCFLFYSALSYFFFSFSHCLVAGTEVWNDSSLPPSAFDILWTACRVRLMTISIVIIRDTKDKMPVSWGVRVHIENDSSSGTINHARYL